MATTPNGNHAHSLPKPKAMKVFLDDIRPTPDGWVRCYWPDEVIELLKTGNVEVVSLDHDLGDDARGTGMDVCKWIEQIVYENGFDGGFIPPAVVIHSANPVGRRNMELAITFFSHHFKTTAGAMDPSVWETYLERVRQYGWYG
jgi:hypothetical protein